MIKYRDYTGEKFNSLTVLGDAYTTNDKYKRRYVKVRCDCGTIKSVNLFTITAGKVISCGCARKITHGMSTTRVYSIWKHIMTRVRGMQRGRSAKYYVGIGCEADWFTFEKWYADVGDPPTDKHTFDRYPDGTRGYFRDNWRWATRREQNNNLKSNQHVHLWSTKYSMDEACRLLSICSKSVLYYIHKHALTPDEALFIFLERRNSRTNIRCNDRN